MTTTPTATVTRAKDFATTGNYEVRINGSLSLIYRDPESGWWYRDEPGKHFSECVIGFTKKEAVENLTARYTFPEIEDPKGEPNDDVSMADDTDAIEEAAPATVVVDAALWKSVSFLIEGLAIMQTLRANHRELHENVVALARAIEAAKVCGARLKGSAL